MASGSEDSGSDINGEMLTDNEDVSSDDDDLQFPEGGRGPWIPVFDQQNYVRDPTECSAISKRPWVPYCNELSAATLGETPSHYIILTVSSRAQSFVMICRTEHILYWNCMCKEMGNAKILSKPKGSTNVLMQGSLIAVCWSDRRAVDLLSTIALPRSAPICTKWKFMQIAEDKTMNCPKLSPVYNRTMGGVDLGDQLISEYSPDIRSLIMWKKVFINLLATAEGQC
ncbi:unnamed protein product [Mytilus coruscus]|uniref:PiggyBac transposable element-derived protein domain-containing protein n=1 Tax=Mytilus coruscus TaxID=42192 RepID=A0A6J8A7F3_MYTCO|nr:unnamed protein product [Mytilus coruscus]